MKHNKELSITIGGSRKETNWKPQRIMGQEVEEQFKWFTVNRESEGG